MTPGAEPQETNDWKPDQYEQCFVEKLKVTNFIPLKAPLMAKLKRNGGYLFRNWATLMFLGQADLLVDNLDQQTMKLKQGLSKPSVVPAIRTLFGSTVLNLRAALDSLAGEVDLLLCGGEPDEKAYIQAARECEACKEAPADFRRRLKATATSPGYATEIKKLLDNMEKAKWYKDLRDYRNEAGHRLPGFLLLEPCGHGGNCYRLRLLKPKLSAKRVWELFSNCVPGVQAEAADFAEVAMYIEEQVRAYLEQTVIVVDAVWGHLASHVQEQCGTPGRTA